MSPQKKFKRNRFFPADPLLKTLGRELWRCWPPRWQNSRGYLHKTGSPHEFSNLCSCEKTHLAVWGCVGYYHWYSQSSRLSTCIMITSHIQYTPFKLHSGYFNRCYDVLKMHTISLILSPLFQKNRHTDISPDRRQAIIETKIVWYH